ncbi:MAG TPA: hypothetical protein PKW30_00440 [Campylobacterales bacterium]|nr:hypothetical protein [Campylobacterales bacterium]
MESKFFSIARKFSFIMAGLTLVIAIGFGLYAATKLISHPVNETIKVPSVSSASYFDEKSASAENEEAKQSPKVLNEKAGKSAVDEAAEKAAAVVTKNLNECASKILGTTGEYYRTNGVADVFKNNFAKQIMDIADEQKAIEFFGAISKDSAEVVKNQQKIKESGKEPTSFIDWYFGKYVEQLKEEKARIEQEKADKEASKVEAMLLVYLAAVAFGIFVSFTIILVLFRIELNTRKQDVSEVVATVEGEHQA